MKPRQTRGLLKVLSACRGKSFALLLTECADSIKNGAYVALPCGLCHGATTLSAWFTCEAKCLIRDKRVTVCVMQGGKVIPALHV